MNKQEIIVKCVEILNKDGLSALTISRLAKEFQVKPPSLYKHITNLNDLYDELGIICLEQLIHLIKNNVFGLSGDAALREIANSFRTFGKNNPGLYQSMQLTHIKRGTAYQNAAENLMNLLYRVITTYNIHQENQVHAIRNFRCILHGFIDLEIRQGFGLPEAIDKSFDMAIEGFILAIKENY